VVAWRHTASKQGRDVSFPCFLLKRSDCSEGWPGRAGGLKFCLQGFVGQANKKLAACESVYRGRPGCIPDSNRVSRPRWWVATVFRCRSLRRSVSCSYRFFFYRALFFGARSPSTIVTTVAVGAVVGDVEPGAFEDNSRGRKHTPYLATTLGTLLQGGIVEMLAALKMQPTGQACIVVYGHDDTSPSFDNGMMGDHCGISNVYYLLLALTWMVLGLTSSALGRVRINTPFWNSAVALSATTVLGREREREKTP
jgi:hypothetical protein